MGFDTYPIQVHADGSITDRPDLHAPDLYDGELSSHPAHGWRLLSGFSGQYRYSGPIMHPSEYIGRGLEQFIRSNPDIYVCVVNYTDSDDPNEPETDIDGWAVAYIPTDEDDQP